MKTGLTVGYMICYHCTFFMTFAFPVCEGFPLSSSDKTIRFIVNSKLTIGVNGCLSLCVMDW